jgi:4a-hydroxytetrahydrobiopterin dehydratase
VDEEISGPRFLASPGVEDWRALWGGGWAFAHFNAPSFERAVELASAIGQLAVTAGHRADVDLRGGGGVTVRLFSGEWQGLSPTDADLARQISIRARELGAVAAPNSTQHVQISIGAVDVAAVRAFWAAVLGYSLVWDTDVLDPLRRGPTFSFQQRDAHEPGKGRLHVDVYVPPDEVETRIEAALRAGGRIVFDNAPHWWTLADPEGNLADLAIWMDD